MAIAEIVKRMNAEIGQGDVVAYSADFLRSIGCYTGIMPCARGMVARVTSHTDNFALATIEWNSPEAREDLPEKVNVRNLAKVGTRAMYAD